MCKCVFSCVWVFPTPWTVNPHAPLSMGFPRQEFWSGLPFHSPGDLPDPGIKSASPALAGRYFYHWATWEAEHMDPVEHMIQLNIWIHNHDSAFLLLATRPIEMLYVHTKKACGRVHHNTVYTSQNWSGNKCLSAVVVQSLLRLTLCNPMDYSTPAIPVLHHFPEFAQTHCPLSQWCHLTISSSVYLISQQ